MKKIVKTMSVILACTLLFAGCAPKDNEAPISSPEDQSQSMPQTPEEIASHNEQIPELDINFPQLDAPAAGAKVAVMDTSKGVIKLMFLPEQAPKAVENFLTHAEAGYYNGLKFHRVIQGFMIQGGDPLGTGTGGESIWKEPFVNEVSLSAFHFQGALSMANSGPDTNGSQFFIVEAGEVAEETLKMMADGGVPQKLIDKYKELGGTPELDGGYSVFGQVIEGMDVVKAIAAVETGANDAPVEDVIINSITVTTI